MQVTQKNLSDTKVQLTMVADTDLLKKAKEQALAHVAKNLKLQGFRDGKAPASMVEKSVDPATLQTEFLDIAMNMMYGQALDENKLHPVAQPKVNVTKFVPFDSLEIDAEVDVIGKITLPDYKNIAVAKPEAKVTTKDIDEVIENLMARDSERKDVDRPAKDGDEVTIDFTGVDTKTKEAINGADGKAYPLVLGSNTFIPGFEPNLIGLKAGEEKTFDIKFPADYGVKTLQKRNVTFTVKATAVKEVVKTKLDDAFAAKVGPFKTVAELKEDIKKQLEVEKQNQAERDFTDQIVTTITDKATVALPKVLVDEQIDRIILEQKQNLMYRGQTWQEFLADEAKTEEEFRESLRPDAEMRVKAGLTLAEIAEVEQIVVTAEELEIRMQLLKGQYPDPQMQAELDKLESRREIASRLLSEKTLAKLRDYASKAKPAAPKAKAAKK